MANVAVIDTSAEALEILQGVLEDEGHTVATADVAELMGNTCELAAFFQAHRPQAVVYHLTLPYVRNWTFFCEHVLAPGYMPESCFVLTTTNKAILDVLVTAMPHTVDVMSRPFDLDAIVEHVDRAVHAYHTPDTTAMQQVSSPTL